MVTENVETELDIANGARGVIEEIVLNSDADIQEDVGGLVTLKRLPLYVLVKMDRTRASKLEGLAENVIPIEPRVQSFRIDVQNGRNKVSRMFKRRQYPMTLAYAFTDYRAQGQTIAKAIVDVAKPLGNREIVFIQSLRCFIEK